MNRQHEPDLQPPLAADPDDELRLRDVWRMLADHPLWVFGLPILCALAALAFVLLAAPRWESTAVVQVGRVGQTTVGQETALIESPQRTIERLKLDSFRDQVLDDLGISRDPNDPNAQLIRRQVELRHIPSTDLIEIKLRGPSPEAAESYARAVVARLSTMQQVIAQPSIDRLKSVLAQTEDNLRLANVERETLKSNMAANERIGPSDRFAESVLLSNLLANNAQEIRELAQRKLQLEEQLSPVRTYPTSLIDGVSVPLQPAWPRPTLTVLLALVGGLGTGIVIALLQGSRKR